MTTHDNPRYVKLDDVLEAVNSLADRKARNGSKAHEMGRYDVGDRRYEEARVLNEELRPAIYKLDRLELVTSPGNYV